ncbi:TolB-like protein/class 3 adenylate cyclase [Sinorhizobium kostiense]|uniref:TolB-like protein/class 3 adenylate cyclase n=1 Tax=Sinorhizobium kostiense TaxID=76747 RepID=A0ABS4QXC0_9HYPH|nr:adenylate/guanylate cyclase domain-containing protein [Sinorhizobium kostiense]MBP2235291.1 TolB-like protein/class 3 adenylate cyclase [Sinorhizobium kostiense]
MQRRLSALLFADVVGYSRLMEEDEQGTLAALKERRRSIIDPIVRTHHGRVVKHMGDGVLVEFRSAVNAVASALELQRRMAEENERSSDACHIVLRIGINLGDVIGEDGDIYGDGVNVASRLEALAEPGGICISGKVHEELQGKLDCVFEDMGEQVVKNIARPIRAYHLRGGDAEPTAPPMRSPLSLQDKPAIAVLPFTNMSSDPEQEYFGEGLADDLITDLSRVSGLMVIARHSSFAYGGKATDIRSMARSLRARYIVEGSVRRAASRVRINAQLIDAQDQSQLWADRFDGDLAEIFDLQDKVVAQIVEALSRIISTSGPATRRRTTSVDAYDLFARARALFAQSPNNVPEARRLLEQALALDPEFAEAYATLAFCHWMGWLHLGEAREPNRTLALSAAQRAVALDSRDAGGHMVFALVKLYDFEHIKAEEAFWAALRLDPNHADSWALMSDLMVMQGRSAEAITCVKNALRLNPHPPGWYYWALGQAQFAAGLYSEAVETLRREETYRTPSQRILAASLARLGRADEARREAAMFLAASPHFTVQDWATSQPFLNGEMKEHFIVGYLQAGLP